MKNYSETDRALRATVNVGRQEIRELQRARAKLMEQISAINAVVNAAEGALRARGVAVPMKAGRPGKELSAAAATPPAVQKHVKVQAAAATEHFDGKKKGGTYKRTPAQRRAISKRVTAQWAAKRAAAQPLAQA